MVDVSRRTTPPLVQLLRCTIWGGLGAFALVALMLVIQRTAATSTQSLAPVAAVSLVAFVALFTLLLRLPQGRGVLGNSDIERWGILLLPGICLIMLGIAVSSPEVSPTAFVLTWLIICAEEGFQLYRQRANLRWPWRSRPAQRAVSNHRPPDTAVEQLAAEDLAANVTQSIVRTRDDDAEAISGTLRADFQTGERTVYTHIAFCPPLAGLPQIEVEQTDGPDATIKVAQILSHGARFDVRLHSAPNEPTQVELAFHAFAAEPQTHGGTETQEESQV